jgi:phage gp16-like protein
MADRTALIAKIHIAKKELALDDDTYRSILKRVTGKESSAKLRYSQLVDVLEEFKNLGFKGKKFKEADDPQARKIYALWTKLFKLGAIADKSRRGLGSFCERMTGVSTPEWLDVEQATKVIESLKQWIARVKSKA